MALSLLSDRQVRNAKPADREITLRDGGGLFLLVKPNGSKLWRFRYKLNGDERASSFGTYPDVSLDEARALREAQRRKVKAGIDFVAVRRTEKSEYESSNQRAREAVAEVSKHSMEAVARQWHASRAHGWSAKYAKKVLENFQRNAFSLIGNRPIASITRADIRDLLDHERIGKAGAASPIPLGEKHKLRQWLSAVFEYAISLDLAESNPADSLRKHLPAKKVKNYATITESRRIGRLLKALDGYSGSFVVACALRLAPLVFVRPGELRNAEWSSMNLDLKEAEWRIAGAKMKSGVEHRVPLSRQAVGILRELQPLTGNDRLVFPGLRPNRPISDNTLNAALRTLGYGSDDITAHGFRVMASTILNEQGWDADAIERQLAHGERNKTRAAYNHALKIVERRKMMQHWADYLDTLRKEKPRPAKAAA